MSTEIPSTSTAEALPGMAPWVDSIQAIKDDVDESSHVMTVFGLAMLEELHETSGHRFVSVDASPLLYHACEVLEHHGLVRLLRNESPGWHDMHITKSGLMALRQAKADRESDIADLEGRMR